MAGKPGSGDQKNGSPGPGTYNLGSAKEHCGGKFGRDPRASLALTQGIFVPGPGAYDSSKRASSSALTSPKFSYASMRNAAIKKLGLD